MNVYLFPVNDQYHVFDLNGIERKMTFGIVQNILKS